MDVDLLGYRLTNGQKIVIDILKNQVTQTPIWSRCITQASPVM